MMMPLHTALAEGKLALLLPLEVTLVMLHSNGSSCCSACFSLAAAAAGAPTALLPPAAAPGFLGLLTMMGFSYLPLSCVMVWRHPSVMMISKTIEKSLHARRFFGINHHHEKLLNMHFYGQEQGRDQQQELVLAAS